MVLGVISPRNVVRKIGWKVSDKQIETFKKPPRSSSRKKTDNAVGGKYRFPLKINV